MKDNNLPDDCQGNNPNFPWNQPEETIDTCWDCESVMIDEDHLIEVETPNRGNQFVCEDCAENYTLAS